MIEKYVARVAWGVRREPPRDCAKRVLEMIESLGQLDSCFTGFWAWSRGRKRVRIPIVPDLDVMTEVLAKGVNRSEGSHEVIESLGYSGTFMTHGNGRVGLYLRVHCGCYSEAVSNVCSVGLPDEGEYGERVLKVDLLSQVMRVMVDATDAEEGIISSHAHWQLVNDHPSTEREVGWLMYFSKALGTVPPLPAPVRIEPVEDRGTLVILTPERLTAANPEHVELGRRVRKLLSRAGLLADARLKS